MIKTKGDNKTPEKIGQFDEADFGKPESSQRWIRFKILLEDYTRRQLSYISDIFNACTGLFHSVYGETGSEFIYGLPEPDFFDALRWSSLQHTTRVPERADLILPTWSWASRQAGIVWYDGAGRFFHEITNENLGPSTNGLVKLQVCLDDAQGWTQIETSNQNQDTVSERAPLKDYPTPIFKHVAKSGRLLFRTQSAFLTLHYGDPWDETEDEYRWLDIHDRDGNEISSIEVDLKWAEKTVRDAPRSCCQFKFVAMSGVSFPPHWTISDLDRHILGTNANIKDEVQAYLNSIQVDDIPDDDTPPPPDFLDMHTSDSKPLHVMLIDPNDSEVARRIGVASLRLVDWLKSDPKMEDIVLE